MALITDYWIIDGCFKWGSEHLPTQVLPSQGMFKQASSTSASTMQFTPAQRAAIDAKKAEKKGMSKEF